MILNTVTGSVVRKVQLDGHSLICKAFSSKQTSGWIVVYSSTCWESHMEMFGQQDLGLLVIASPN